MAQTLREQGAVTPLAFPLSVLVGVHARRGDFAGAGELAREASALGEEAIGPFLQAMALNSRAFVASYVDDADVCVANAERARAISERLGDHAQWAVSEQALGMLALSRGEVERAIGHLERARELSLLYGARDPGYLCTDGDLCEAYARAARLDDAARALEDLRAGAQRSGGAWAAAATARYAALLGSDDELDEHLPTALAAHERAHFAFEEARTRLLFGERLRRARRRADARPLLAAAEAAFSAQGAPRWAERAAAELVAAGGRPRGNAPPEPGLTPREREVCALVADGATNAEVAAALFLSTRTVEHHLRHIYRKLGVRSRSELAVRCSTENRAVPSRDLAVP